MEEESPEKSFSMSDYEDLIEAAVGKTGFSQWFICLVCRGMIMIVAWAMIMMSFAGAEPTWWTETIVKNVTANTSRTIKNMSVCPTSANQKIYFGKDIISIVGQWNLVCSKNWIPALITTIQMAGVFTGSATSGQLGDWIGRKRSLFLYFFGTLLFTFISAFSVNWQMFAVLRFLIGVTLGGDLLIAIVLPLEYLPKTWRTMVSCIPFWAFGVMLFGVLFLFVKDWRHLSIIASVAGIPFLIALYFIPESCRWLFVHGHTEKAKEVIKTLARRNGRPEPDLSSLERVIEEDIKKNEANKTYTYIDLFKHRKTIFLSGIFAVQWFSCGLSYYGLTFGIGALSGDKSLNMILAGLTEAAALLTLWFGSKYIGRKKSSMLWLFMCAIFSLSITVTYHVGKKEDFKKYMNILALISRLSLAAAWQSIITATNEHFPTCVRSVGYGMATIFSRIGGLVASQIDNLSKINVEIPYTVYGTLCIISMLTWFALPDTYDAPLEDYLEKPRSNDKTILVESPDHSSNS